MLNVEKKIDHIVINLKKYVNFFRCNSKIVVLTFGKGFYLKKNEKKKIKNYWRNYGIFISNYQWHKICCNLNGFNERYVTYPIFINHILPYLNNLDFLRSYNDKNMLNKLFPKIKQPKVFYRNINGKSYDNFYNKIQEKIFLEDFLKSDGEYIIKPTVNSGNARGIKLILIKEKEMYLDNEKISFENLTKIYKNNFLIEEKLEQSDIFRNISPNSLSTIGVTTLRWEGEMKVLNAYMKFGTGNNIIDNMATGGVEIGVDLKTGKLKKYALSKYLEIFEYHPDSKAKYEGVEIPKLKEIILIATECHKKLLYFDFVVWDFALDKNNDIYLIEPNLGAQSTNSLQINNGPLFGELSDEVFEKIFIKRK